MVDNPSDQNSRWSTAGNSQSQFLTLRLEQPAIVGTILFGKYHKGHICNLKEFRVYCGQTEDSMVEVLLSGLRNDEEPEVFPVRHLVAPGVLLPSRFIKIVPVTAWGASFSYSIWYLRFGGVADPGFVSRALAAFSLHRERLSLALCLKHLRQRHLDEPFNALLRSCPFSFEHPLLSRLHEDLVTKGDFAATELLLENAASLNLFDDYIRTCPCK